MECHSVIQKESTMECHLVLHSDWHWDFQTDWQMEPNSDYPKGNHSANR